MVRWDADASKQSVTAASKLMSVNNETKALEHILSGELQAFVQGKAFGLIAYNAAAPTPAQTGEYTFSTAGLCSWLTDYPVDKNVVAGDKVLVIYDVALETYSYELVKLPGNVASQMVNDSSVVGATVKNALETLNTGKEDVLNKKSTITDSETDYPCCKAVGDALFGYTLKDELNGYKEIEGTAEAQSGYYRYDSGELVPNDWWKSKKYSLDAGKDYYATLVLAGDTAAFAIYLDEAGTYISSEQRGLAGKELKYVNRKLVKPTNAKYVLLSNASHAEVYPILSTIQFNPISKSDVESLTADNGSEWTVIAGLKESQTGYYNKDTGAFTPSGWWWSTKYPINPLVQNFATAKIGASVTALACYYTGKGAFISSEYIGADGVDVLYNRKLLTVPANAEVVGISNAEENTYPTLETYIPNNRWTRKKIWWCGTSIPATGYPQIVGNTLNASMNNQSQAASMARATKWDGSMVGMHYQNCLLSLSQTFAEKQSIMDHWTTGLNSEGVVTEGGTYGWRDLFTGNPPSDYNEWANQASILSYSFENKLMPYLDTTDLFVFDHGHNDVWSAIYDESDESSYAPTISTDRRTFISSMNFLFGKILTANPRARIVIIGHYENDRKTNIYKAQENLAKLWGFPLLKLWEKLGFSQMKITTNGYWSDAYTWVGEYGPIVQKTMTEVWMQDDLHPYSFLAKNHFAGNIVDFLKGLK